MSVHYPANTEFIITIDGPAGAGKSSVAKGLAKKFDFEFLDTGAMYRAVTLAVLRANLQLDDAEALADLAKSLQLEFRAGALWMNGEDVSSEIRTDVVNSNIRYVADNPEIRHTLGSHQRRLAQGKKIVTEGRDQGTEIFPDAACKIFLTATPETRAHRRHQELLDRGEEVTYEEVFQAQEKRDLEDSTRPTGALRPAVDAVVVATDGMTYDEVIQRLSEIVSATCSR